MPGYKDFKIIKIGQIIYFTGMVRYIEHHARISSSRWCKSEPLVVSSDCQAENVTGKANPRSADNGQEWRTIEPRDESLQCGKCIMVG